MTGQIEFIDNNKFAKTIKDKKIQAYVMFIKGLAAKMTTIQVEKHQYSCD